MMKKLTCLAMMLALGCTSYAEDKKAGEKKVSNALAFTMKDIDGKEVELSKYEGKVVVFVNVASRCGYTPQYEGLQALYKKYEKDGLVVIGVPANEFGAQEPGTDAQIKEFCSTKYNVTFPMLSKVVVKGDDICPLYKYLTSKDTNPDFAGNVGWNFEKFLINKKGEVVGRYKSSVAPDAEEFTKAIEDALKAK